MEISEITTNRMFRLDVKEAELLAIYSALNRYESGHLLSKDHQAMKQAISDILYKRGTSF